jgi:hypothetical protein
VKLANCLASILALIATSCAASPPAARAPYFPSSEFSDLPVFYANVPAEFAAFLHRANEDPIAYNDARLEIRLTIRSAFKGSVIITAVERSDGVIHGRVKRFEQKRDHGGETLVADSSVAFTPENMKLLFEALRQRNFWALDNSQKTIGSDGSDWLLEAKDGNRYNVIYRWWPMSGPIFEVGRLLTSLAKVPLFDR